MISSVVFYDIERWYPQSTSFKNDLHSEEEVTKADAIWQEKRIGRELARALSSKHFDSDEC